MKKKIALLLAVLMILCALPLTAQAAPGEDSAVYRETRIPLSSLQLQVLDLMEAAIRARQDSLDLKEYHIALNDLIDVIVNGSDEEEAMKSIEAFFA